VQDSADDTPIIDSAGPRLVRRQVRLNGRPGFVAQPEKTAHPRLHSQFEGKESDLLHQFNSLMGF